MKKINMLSIDGGGIRGIIPGTILTYLEKQLQLQSQTDKKLGDYFDFISGTSTGGILACIYLFPGEGGHALYSAADAVRFYLDYGPVIFRRSLGRKIANPWNLVREKYAATEIENCFRSFFQDRLLHELIKPCLITSYDITSRNAHFFTSVEAAQSTLSDFRIVDVARSTSAAPSYFSPARITSMNGQIFNLVDGGVYANNPALCAYAEVRKISFSKLLEMEEGKPDRPSAKDMLLLSIGTGTVKKTYTFRKMRHAGNIEWLAPVLDILMSGNAETVDYQLRQMYNTLDEKDRQDYYRLEPPLHEAVSEMDKVSGTNLENLRQAGLLFIDKNRALLDRIVAKILLNQ